MSIKISKNKEWLLALFWAGGRLKSYNEQIIGRTRLMREMFLLKEQFNIHDNMYIFEATKYGPISRELLRDLGKARKEGLVFVSESIKGYAYSLTLKGCEVANEVFNELTDDIQDNLRTVKDRYNQMRLSQLLGYVYSRYPKYTMRPENTLIELW